MEKTSRRNFIKSTSAAAAGFTIVPRHVLGGSGFTAPSEKLVVAGIGVGGMGSFDLKTISESGKAEVAYLCDVDDRRAAPSVERFPKARYYKDFRDMLNKEHRHIDAVCIATPEHNHAIQALAAMQLGKHVYVEKPLAHDIWEARVLTDAAKRYKVVTQMGNQGASNDGPRLAREWYEAGVIGDVHTVYCWTDRPNWPTSIPWPSKTANVPTELDWNLWLGTARYRDYVERLVPSNWRWWWDFGTGAMGEMGCHIMEAPFSVLGLQYVQEVHASVGNKVFLDEFVRGEYPDSIPPSSHVTMRFAKTSRTQGPVTLHWMDGGILPSRPDELGLSETLGNGAFSDGLNGALLVGTKGKILFDAYGKNPRLLPTSRQVEVPQKYARVEKGEGGHRAQWVDACLAGYGKKALSSPFEVAGALTEATLVANLAIRGAELSMEGPGFGRNIKMLWDHEAMQITNFDIVNQFVKRAYRPGWEVRYTL